MYRYTAEELIAEGYKLQNAQITDADLSMDNHAALTSTIVLDGGDWGVCYGGYCLGKGYLGAKDDCFKGSAAGLKSIMMIMDTVGVERFSELKGKYVRAATKGCGASVKIIGNIIDDKWFDYESFFADERDGE